jgi:hypothetical protein
MPKLLSKGKLGLLDYQIYDVRGDGSCFYRAVYQVLRESPKDLERLGGTADLDEEDGVEHIRIFVGKALREKANHDALDTIDNLCMLVNEADEDDRQQLYEDLNEMYPFVTKKVCNAKGDKRYGKVAELIEDMDDMMYASSLEIDVVKQALAKNDIAILVISMNGRKTKATEAKWKSDLLGLLKNCASKNVMVLLNKNNVHYQYIVFKGPSDEAFQTITKKSNMVAMLEEQTSSVLEKQLERMHLQGGGGKSIKQRRLARLYSVAQ